MHVKLIHLIPKGIGYLIHNISTIFIFPRPFLISSPLSLVPTAPHRTCFNLLQQNF
jgi:hypothetical protein